jgi:hypothetical protein
VRTKGTIGEEQAARNGDKIGHGTDPKGKKGKKGRGEGGRARGLTSAFCRPHKPRTVRGKSLGLPLVFVGDGRRKRRSPRRENRNYV